MADYVLLSYGTGAVVGVPGGQDLRDFEFSKKFNLPIRPVIHPRKAKEETIKEIDSLETCFFRPRCFSSQSL